ncbi:DUF4304 domain-containing protein [Chryseobacterium sp. MEBOG06]|uniref:DUF4304 domain-containing protein n=1 Tax=Chryseobacterium sp. MEBOG06 TaxID=2879938 RepID=UPI001F212E3C|nr:DUF4304 domain-containing protein [Chryseobacterium sp. MEBOG06]UKB82568.1 DUF4304 domain-containing protein [Chryseobacterium sp. MEBOG06]
MIKLLDDIFITAGFKRKGNNWVMNGEEINKIINLQKSQYNNSFYINYGYVINRLPLNGFVNHVDNRLSSASNLEDIRISENMRITYLLSLESDIADNDRLVQLKELINDKVLTEMNSTNNEQDLLSILKNGITSK